MSTSPSMSSEQPVPAQGSPFNLENDTAYQLWRKKKLRDYPSSLDELTVTLANPDRLTTRERSALLENISKTNFAVFQYTQPLEIDKLDISRLGEHLGLRHLDQNLCADEDKISSITVDRSGNKGTYIPYTNRPISWHTDGYYNDTPGHAVKSFILYCAHPATTGGTNRLMDHELAYIRLRDQDPELVRALMHSDAMNIPANIVDGKVIRESQSGPVFIVDDNDRLSMRYTARTRSIQWRKNPATQQAVESLACILKDENNGIFEHRLAPGQGVISNNVLHMRTGFEDSDDKQPRLFFRARYYQRIDTTSVEQTAC